MSNEILTYEEIYLKYKPMDKYYGRTKNKKIRSEAILVIHWNKKANLGENWTFSDLTYDDITSMEQMTDNKASCVLHLTSKNKHLKKFAELKTTIFKNINIRSNWDLYDKLFEHYTKDKKLEKTIKKLETEIFGKDPYKTVCLDGDNVLDVMPNDWDEFVQTIGKIRGAR